MIVLQGNRVPEQASRQLLQLLQTFSKITLPSAGMLTAPWGGVGAKPSPDWIGPCASGHEVNVSRFPDQPTSCLVVLMLGMHTSSVQIRRLVMPNFIKTVRYCSLNRYPLNPFRELLGRREGNHPIRHQFACL